MGLVGIRLDVATVLIAAIAIGISVNDTSHIMFRFKQLLEENADEINKRLLALSNYIDAVEIVYE